PDVDGVVVVDDARLGALGRVRILDGIALVELGDGVVALPDGLGQNPVDGDRRRGPNRSNRGKDDAVVADCGGTAWWRRGGRQQDETQEGKGHGESFISIDVWTLRDD